ncbi:hypothetical protein EIN_152420 [Entamoeba invadens IP1]|uniref:Uncharacterized protein n=1 Tax=Entamoeba invadens IP1 TaxID=370355 RepID=A0A0A1U8K8_ENTIV|nr:hypothetical protein EIN_152420 [Entamoeba invadens IP1]ELP91265.1 hypothetical protein EIN_152420 [Entamoeba invadens IP1]|eukprot:XP_004258036.1 hypothetical protein EIN_152420 [Entamoeba invadens IP1]
MNFIQLVMTYDNTELYKELYTTYRTKGVNFPPLTQPDYDDKDATSVTQTPALPFDIETNCKPKEGLSPVKNKVELPQPQKLAVQDVSTNEIFETLPADFRKLLQTMSEFHELCKEPLKRSNLLRNGSLQLHHQLQCDENFFKKAIDIQKEFKNRFNEYSNVEEPDDEIIAALTEEGRKIGHIVRVFKNEISRIKKLETKIEDGVGDMKLAEVPSYGVDAMMSAGVAYPKTTSEAVKIMDMMSHTKGNTLSREDSVTESTSNSETPAGNGHMQQRKSMLFFPPIAPLPQESSKAISFKGIKKENIVKMTSSVDTTRMYTGFL